MLTLLLDHQAPQQEEGEARAIAAALRRGRERRGGREMARTLITDVTIFDGSGREPFAGEVLVQGNRIAKWRPAASPAARRRTGSSTAAAPC